jgi:hypothetical protein
MRMTMVLGLSLMFAGGVAIAGDMEAPGDPALGSGMYSFQQLYDYLVSGTALTVPGGFYEPASGPSGGTMKNIKEIGDAITALHEQCTATEYDVALGKTFFCTQPGNWGVQTGKVCIIGTPTPTITPTQTPTVTPTPTLTPTPTITPHWLTWSGAGSPSTHSEEGCVAAGGTVYATGTQGRICKFSGTNVAVPGGWTQAEHWQAYSVSIWGGDACGYLKAHGPTEFSNVAAYEYNPGDCRSMWGYNCSMYQSNWHTSTSWVCTNGASGAEDPTTNRLEVGCY